MSVGQLVCHAIALMRCAPCGRIMTQGERERCARDGDDRPVCGDCATRKIGDRIPREA